MDWVEEDDGTREAWGGLKIRAESGSNGDQGLGEGPQSANNCPVDVQGCKLHITVAPTLRDVDSLCKPDGLMGSTCFPLGTLKFRYAPGKSFLHDQLPIKTRGTKFWTSLQVDYPSLTCSQSLQRELSTSGGTSLGEDLGSMCLVSLVSLC